MKKIVYFVNQFYGLIGGEEAADQTPIVKEGSVGPAVAMQEALKDIIGPMFEAMLQGEMNMTLNMTIMTSARDAVGKCLATLGGEYDNMLVLTADVDTSSRIQAFKEKYPDRCYNVGIAEQNLMSVSAGLAHEGFRPLAFAFAPFASMRCYEQVRTDICYS